MIEHKGEKYYTADEVIEMMDEFASKIDSKLHSATATELNEEIKNFMNSYNNWCQDLFYLAQFDGVGKQFNLESGGDMDSWLDKNLPKHCKLFELGERYYFEAWFDEYELSLHDEDDKVYKMKMAYVEELQKYAKEGEIVKVGYNDESEITDYEHLKSYRFVWLNELKGFKRGTENGGKVVFGRLMPEFTKISADNHLKDLVPALYVDWFDNSLQYGNMFDEKTIEQSRAIMKEWPDWLKYGFRYYFMKEAFIDRLEDPKSKEVFADYFASFNTTIENVTKKYNEYSKKYKIALDEAFEEE